MRVTFEYGTTTKVIEIPDEQMALVGQAFGYYPEAWAAVGRADPYGSVEEMVIAEATGFFNQRVADFAAQQAAQQARQQAPQVAAVEE